MAAKWDIDFDEKEKDVVVDHANMLDDQRKEYKGMLIIKVFQVHVEVELDNPPPKTQHLVKAAQEAAKGLEEMGVSAVKALAKEIADLQKEEKLGNKKAAETARKLVEKVDKALKNLAGEFGGDIRKSVQKALIGANKQKLMSTSRTIFRGIELDEFAFTEDPGGELPSFFKDTVKELATAGSDAYKLTSDEADSRLALGQAVKSQLDAIQKWLDDKVQKGGKGTFDMPLYVKESTKEIHKLSQAKEKYVDFLKDFEEKLTKTLKELDKLEQLSFKQKALKENKEVSRTYESYRGAAKDIQKTFDAKRKAAATVDTLFTAEWKGGHWFDIAQRTLEKQAELHKFGKAMQDAGKALEKLSEKLEKQ